MSCPPPDTFVSVIQLEDSSLTQLSIEEASGTLRQFYCSYIKPTPNCKIIRTRMCRIYTPQTIEPPVPTIYGVFKEFSFPLYLYTGRWTGGLRVVLAAVSDWWEPP